MKQFVITFVALVFLGACQTTSHQVADNGVNYLNDDAFSDHALFHVESEDEVFGLDEEARKFIRYEINTIYDPIDRMETLVRKIFDRSEFNLLYMGSANTTAAETFANKAANCLSMTIMTYALAREANLNVAFQDIKIPEYWTRKDGYSLLNGHVNLKLFPRADPLVIRMFDRGLTVDFDPQERRKMFPVRPVSVQTILAMYYNNKGADALVSNEYSKAYAYFRAAVKADPKFDSTYVNLGFLYRLHEHYEFAELAYNRAIELDHNNLTAWENLSVLYDFQGRSDVAQTIRNRIVMKRTDNPYYHFMLGETAFDSQEWEIAIRHYRDALKLDKTKHEIYFGLAKTYLQLGDVMRSKRYLARARKLSSSRQDQERYQGKLDLLSRL